MHSTIFIRPSRVYYPCSTNVQHAEPADQMCQERGTNVFHQFLRSFVADIRIQSNNDIFYISLVLGKDVSDQHLVQNDVINIKSIYCNITEDVVL